MNNFTTNNNTNKYNKVIVLCCINRYQASFEVQTNKMVISLKTVSSNYILVEHLTTYLPLTFKFVKCIF